MTDEINLLHVCANAFVAVVILLSLLAVALRILNRIFPPEEPVSMDPTIASAILTAVQTVAPGAKVTQIEPG